MDKLTEVVIYFGLISMTAERLVDLFRKTFPNLTLPGSVYQLATALIGGGITYMSPPDASLIPLNQYLTVVVAGLATSGGSSLWHEVLSILNNYKQNLKTTNK